MDNIYDILYNKIITQITADLTTGRIDNKKKPFKTAKINNFIQQNEHNIDKTIKEIINDYTEDNELEELNNPENDWIREYLYNYIKY